MSEIRYMISDAARQAGVEAHVLRSWEEELDIKVGRTELGHRYYTDKTIYIMKKVKELRDKGFQLKAIKVLIPETEVWYPGQERPPYVLRNMSGAETDYIILDVDREGGVAIGSRRMALAAQRHFFDTIKGGRSIGEKLTCRVLAVGPRRCLVECGGRDMSLSQKDLTYIATPDLRTRYHPGQTLNCVLKEYDRREGQFWVSVKDTVDNPFFGALRRHPIGSRRQAVISGKYGGGVFCTLSDETVCLCHYSTLHSDLDFHVGDTVILAIKQFDYERSLIYGRILSKW